MTKLTTVSIILALAGLGTMRCGAAADPTIPRTTTPPQGTIDGGTPGDGGDAPADAGPGGTGGTDAGGTVTPADGGTTPTPRDAGALTPPRDASAIVTDCPEDAGACGPVFVVKTLKIGNEATGFDYTGDGVVDNRLSSLGTFTVPGLLPQSPNAQLQNAVNNGSALLLAEIRGLDDPTGQNDDNVTVAIYSARDGDCTGPTGSAGCTPADNFSGTEEFCVMTEALEPVTFRAKYIFPGATIRNGLLAAGPSTFGFRLPISNGVVADLVLKQAQIKATVANNLTGLSAGVIGGILPVVDLDKILVPNPISNELSVFDAIHNFMSKTPDIDWAGDGIESYAATNGLVTDICCKAGTANCRNASAADRINANNDKNCAQAPEIDDGYSIGLNFTAVPGRVRGIVSRGACP